MGETVIGFTLNGDPVEVRLTRGDRTLLEVLRDDLGLTGAKHGCGIGACGTCTVLVDGYPVAACLQLAALIEGSQVLTVEGLAAGERLHPVQQAFVNCSALQCGVCIPAHVLTACALLERNPDPGEDEIRAAADNVYCRCTGYARITEAYREAARLLRAARAKP